MDSHLVTIEVGVECLTYEWVQLECLSFDEYRLECLDTKSVECRRSVEHDWMFLDYVIKDCPYLRSFGLDEELCSLYVLCNAVLYELLHDEWLEEFKCHL